MKAILMTEVGGPEVLVLRDIPIPELPSSYNVRVKLAAAGVNPVDTKIRAHHNYYPDRLPVILGCDGAGVVDAVGNSVTRFKVGDEVYFFNGGLGDEPGTYCEYTIVHEDYCAMKPRNMSMEEAAAVPLVLITAWEALNDRTRLKSEQTILIHAGAGGVGHVAIQLAKNIGAFVATTVSSDAKAEFVTSLGAELAINYTKEDFVEAALEWTDGMGVKCLFDTIGGETFGKSFGAVRLYGSVVSILSSTASMEQLNTARLRNLTIGYVQMTAPMFLGHHGARLAQTRILEAGAKMIEEGKLKIKVSEALPLEDAVMAHGMIERGHTTGKIVLKL